MSDISAPQTTMDDEKVVMEERNEASSRAVPHSHIQGLYPSFSTAVTILRKLEPDVVNGF